MKKNILIFFILLFLPLVFAHETEQQSFLIEHASTLLPIAIGTLLAMLIIYKIIKKMLFVLMAVIFIGIGVLLASYYHISAEKNIVGNEQILEELKTLQFITVERNLTLYDLQNIEVQIEKDKIAQSFVEEMRWLIAHSEPEHAEHSLAFLQTYVKTGDSLFCIPHEIDHVLIYLKYNETDHAKEIIYEIKEYIPQWVQKAKEGKKSFPQYYQGFDEVKEKTVALINQLASGDYSETVKNEAKKVAEKGIC